MKCNVCNKPMRQLQFINSSPWHCDHCVDGTQEEPITLDLRQEHTVWVDPWLLEQWKRRAFLSGGVAWKTKCDIPSYPDLGNAVEVTFYGQVQEYNPGTVICTIEEIKEYR